jgi:hypothetical protein
MLDADLMFVCCSSYFTEPRIGFNRPVNSTLTLFMLADHFYARKTAGVSLNRVFGWFAGQRINSFIVHLWKTVAVDTASKRLEPISTITEFGFTR